MRALSAEVVQAALKLVAEHGTVEAAARASGIPRTTLRDRVAVAVQRGLDESIVHPAPVGHIVKGVSTYYNKDGERTGQWVKTKAGELDFEEITEAITGAFEDWRSTWMTDGRILLPFHSDAVDGDLLTVYPLPDLHIGLLSWRHETDVDWDLKIAKRVLAQTTQRVFDLSPPSKECVILGLGDLLHSDGYENLTPASKNILDVDGRWPKVLRTAVWLIVDTVERALLKHEHVTLRILPGNHDPESAFAVALALSMRYEDHPRVTVDTSPSYFWWYEYGNTLLGATHGDKAKMADLPLIMAQRCPEAWGRTKYRQLFTGHIHTQTAVEKAGVTVESFRTPVAPDTWHTNMGYNAGRTMSSITFHKEYGEIARARTPIIGEENAENSVPRRPDLGDDQARGQ